MYRGLIFASSLSLFFALAEETAAQGVGWTLPATGNPEVGTAGDVDGDTVPDFAVGDAGAGELRVYSGTSGAQVLVLLAPLGDSYGTPFQALGDVNGDGHGDLAVHGATLTAGYLRGVSGMDGSTLWEVVAPSGTDLGAALAQLGDVDGDGARDLAVVVSVGGASGSHHVEVLSGATGSVLRALAGTSGFGRVLEVVRDRDGDGERDLLLGDPDFATFDGRVTLHSSLDGALLAAIPAPAGSGLFGWSLAAVGDQDGEGVDDVYVGSPAESPDGYASGKVRLISGATGAVLFEPDDSAMGGGALAFYGRNLAVLQDQDGDGQRDLAIGAGMYRAGCCAYYPAEVRVHSARTGQLLWATVQEIGGAHFEIVPDANGDGREDLMAAHLDSAWFDHEGATPAPAAVIFTSLQAPIPLELLCQAKVTSEGCMPRLLYTGAPSPTSGAPLALRADGLPAGTTGLFLWSDQWVALPFHGGTLCAGAPQRRLGVHVATTNEPPCAGSSAPTGSITRPIPRAELAQLGLPVGNSMIVQAWFRDRGFAPPDDVGLTGPLGMTLWP